ncbi:MAG: 3,4-dihydroxy-2-butanone-4-phosphate synthase, partial [Pseudomonadota bacterium]
FTISVEAARGVTTGISAHDRAHTIRTLIDPESTPDDIVMPGHTFPLRAREDGVLERDGQTEASVDLAKLAGLTPAAMICEVMKDDGEMARLPDLEDFAGKHGLKIISVKAIADYRRAMEASGDALRKTG